MKTTVEFRQHGTPVFEEYDSLREALLAIDHEVESNQSAPFAISTHSSLFGVGMVKFTCHQIYAMLTLVRNEQPSGIKL